MSKMECPWNVMVASAAYIYDMMTKCCCDSGNTNKLFSKCHLANRVILNE